MGPVELIAATARAFGVDAREIFGSKRVAPIRRAKFATAWVLRNRYDPRLSLTRVGELMGRQDHSTVHYGLGRAEELRASCPEFRAKTDALLTFDGELAPLPGHPRHPAVLLRRIKPKNEIAAEDTDARMRLRGTMKLERALRAAMGEPA